MHKILNEQTLNRCKIRVRERTNIFFTLENQSINPSNRYGNMEIWKYGNRNRNNGFIYFAFSFTVFMLIQLRFFHKKGETLFCSVYVVLLFHRNNNH